MLLDKLKGPADLRNLPPAGLAELAEEIRNAILDVVMKNGGHLAPSLGAVELAIALHLAFDSPADKIIWDVGHQAYAHKIITGRADRFATLRKAGGLSGYPCPGESPHDHFYAGHASTSVSLAAGLAQARDRLGQSYQVVAVIGDGGLTGGIAFEALNNLGHSRKHVILVVNDNTMSIAPSVGALSLRFSMLRSHPAYEKMKSDLDQAMRKIPLFGDDVARSIERLKRGVKQLVVPAMFFEEMGFTYLGPVPGHDVRSMERYFEAAKRIKGPVAVHVLTDKGKGYPPAETEPERFHGVSGGRRPAAGQAPGTGRANCPTYSQVFGTALKDLAAEDERIVAVTAAMGSGTGLDAFEKAFPDRFFDVGIAEQHAVCSAVGMWKGGLKPVVAVYSTFLQRAYDQLAQDVCLNGAGVVLAIDRAGLVGEDGPTHHGVFDLAYLRHLPGIVVMAPRDAVDLCRMLKLAVRLEGPAAIRYPRSEAVPEISPRGIREPLETGRAELVYESNRLAFSLGIVTLGSMVGPCIEAATMLRGEGIGCDVLDLRFVKPIDLQALVGMLRPEGRSRPLLVVEEHSLAGGLGSAVLESLSDAGLRPEVHRLGLPDRFIPHGAREDLLSEYGLDSAGIAAKARAIAAGAGRA